MTRSTEGGMVSGPGMRMATMTGTRRYGREAWGSILPCSFGAGRYPSFFSSLLFTKGRHCDGELGKLGTGMRFPAREFVSSHTTRALTQHTHNAHNAHEHGIQLYDVGRYTIGCPVFLDTPTL